MHEVPREYGGKAQEILSGLLGEGFVEMTRSLKLTF
jgi:hypothetical protein